MKRLLLSLFLSNAVQAATLMDPSQVLPFPVAREGLTRITIENDGIEDIFAYPSDLEGHIQHHKSGHVFVAAHGIEGPLFITLITKRGIAQDLKLIPTRKTTEPILLKFDIEEAKGSPISMEDLLKSFMKGAVPQGFYPITIGEVSRSSGNINAVLAQAFQNAQYRVLIFDVKSEISVSQNLDTSSMWAQGDLAVSFDTSSLEEGQVAKLYVIQHVE